MEKNLVVAEVLPASPAPRRPIALGFVGVLGLAVAAITSTSIAANTWKSVRGRVASQRTIEVTGSAKKRITSDTIAWSANISASDLDRTAAYKKLRTNAEATVAFLKSQGIKAEEILPQSVTFNRLTHNEVTRKTVATGKEEVTSREVFDGFAVDQTITVRSHDVDKVERASREVTSLLEQGITIESQAPAYFYSKLGELKLEMLSAAGKDARSRAENILKSAGGASLGKLVVADMGIININPANSSSTSEEGNNDVTSMEKDIITIVHATFELN
ncbi:MAG: SIMPL domain-containing protein [Kofleriaceae bacterium]|nr:SIMPL domain-containing protein [Kofleriaceae bacterium]